MHHLSVEEILYYKRHFSLPGFDEESQLKIRKSSVLVIGCGGLGAPCLLYLAGAGVGRIGIVDNDVVSESNLPRQVIFDYHHIGKSKVEQASKRILALNPFIKVETYPMLIDRSNVKDVISSYDIVIDCTDNFDAKYLLNDTCETLHKPLVYSSIFQFEGQLAVFHYGENPKTRLSYRDLFPAPPRIDLRENCNDAGVLGMLPGILGTMQAGEAIKIITGIGEVLCEQVMIYDLLTNRSSLLQLKKRDSMTFFPENNTVEHVNHVTFDQFIMMKNREPDLFLLDVREQSERDEVSIGGMHIPLRELPEHLEELPREKKIVCYCKSGGRSKRAILFLQDKGFSNLFNLAGGVMGLTHNEKKNLQNMDG